MLMKRKWKGVSVFVLSFVLLFVSMGLGGSQAHASEQGMLSINYVTENSVSIHFSSNVGIISNVSLSQDGVEVYSTTTTTFDYVATSLRPDTEYLIQINGKTRTGKVVYDETYVTTTAIPDEPETIGVDLGVQGSPDATGSALETVPSFDDTTYGGATIDSYYEGVKRTSAWDLVGSNKFYMPNNSPQFSLSYTLFVSGYVPSWNSGRGSIIYSTGGEFKIRAKGVSLSSNSSSSKNLVVVLYEYDSSYSRTRVKTWEINPTSSDQDLILYNAGDYVDGANKKAEFFIEVLGWYKPYDNYHTFSYWD